MTDEKLDILAAAAENSSDTDAQDDELAKKEKKKLFDDFDRGESYKTTIHRIVIIFMYIIAACFAVMVIIRAYDFVAPDCWRWLSERQDHDLERIVFSGIIISVATKYFKKYNIVEK